MHVCAKKDCSLVNEGLDLPEIVIVNFGTTPAVVLPPPPPPRKGNTGRLTNRLLANTLQRVL